jgi:hypothetical protein
VGDAAAARLSAAGTLRSCASWRWPGDSSALLEPDFSCEFFFLL